MSATNGRLAIVGLGPGDAAYLCERARPALAAAEVVIAYAPYCDRVGALLPGIPVEPWPIGAEAERAAGAAARARAGASVAVVSSGDPGVYGMAGLCLEALYELGWDGLRDPEVEIVPGVTAALAAASRLGAPLAVDFACISLSDLLVPWELIERRLEAIGAGDLAVALYNPRSRARPHALDRALTVLRAHRDPATPAALVHDACRPGERVEICELDRLRSEEASMDTLVVIGCSSTRRLGRHLVTLRPRHSRGGGS
ncbi:MAG TPA: precorrin-3B C(17)-methyltransferase [Candidatus Dormibacteraeota bacterium]